MAMPVRSPLATYWEASRAHRHSLLFALPLLLAYEALATLLAAPTGGLRNGADVILRSLVGAIAGQYEALAFAVVVIGTSIWLIARDLRSGGKLRPGYLPLMLLESALLASVFGLVVGTVTAQLLGAIATLDGAGARAVLAQANGSPIQQLGPATQLMVSLGAGLYEELLFRVIVVAAIAFVGRAFIGWRPFTAGAVATVLGALIFSAFHYVGPYGDPFQVQSFTFRAIAGLFFSALYLTRGFGITAWTHALYDVFLLL
jgi:hypothetical protein